MTNDTSKKQDLVFTRIFEAPVELLWQAWTDPETLMQWWGPDIFTCPSAMIDLREGGTSIICMRAPKEFGGQDMYSTWYYTKIIPLERIELIHNLSDKDGNKIDPAKIGMPANFPQGQRQVIAFRKLGEGRTELSVTQFGWLPGNMMEMAKMGMEQTLVKMAKVVEGSYAGNE